MTNHDLPPRLQKNQHRPTRVLVVVMDGIGHYAPHLNDRNLAIRQGDAVAAAHTPNLWELYKSPLFRTLKAHGKSVGLPSDEDMGNSEVGHNALGAGRVFAQGAKLVNEAIASGRLFEGDTWSWLVDTPALRSGAQTLHLCGLLSDGNVHSHIQHLFALIEGAKKSGVAQVRLHMLLDGRDVPPLSALEYIEKLEGFLTQINDAHFSCQVASGGGRTFVTMDRYESDWRIVERGYKTHILGEGRTFANIKQAVQVLRDEGHFYDQDLPPFVIAHDGVPLGLVHDDDAFVFFNFRGDRAIEICRALTEENFTPFVRTRFPKVRFAGMMEYDGDLHIPRRYLVTPPAIDHTMSELLSFANVRQFACSETQKYGHVTYFWNGNRSGKFNEKLENYVEIPSDLTPFAQRPWMKSAEIADRVIAEMQNDTFDVGRINFPNGDMVGHTGCFASAVYAVEAVDLALGRLRQTARQTGTVLVITADHGNADEMFEIDKKRQPVLDLKTHHPRPKTSHTLAPVPFVIDHTEILEWIPSLRQDLPEAGLANVAATVLRLAGFQAPTFYEADLLE